MACNNIRKGCWSLTLRRTSSMAWLHHLQDPLTPVCLIVGRKLTSGGAFTASPTLTLFREFLWKLHIWTVLVVSHASNTTRSSSITRTCYTCNSTRLPGVGFADAGFSGSSCVLQVSIPILGCTSFLEDYDSHEGQDCLLANRFICQLMSPRC